MQRINSTNRAANKFGAGKDGFQGGSPATGVKATYVTPEWANAVQEEIARAIEGAGIALDASKHDQLLAAIKSIAWGAGKTEAPWLSRTGGTLTGALYADGGSGAGTGIKGDTDQDTGWEWPSGGVMQELVDSVIRSKTSSSDQSRRFYNGGFETTMQSDGNIVVRNSSNGVVSDLYSRAPLASPALTGAPTAPTAAAGTNTTQLATTAFVQTGLSSRLNKSGDIVTGLLKAQYTNDRVGFVADNPTEGKSAFFDGLVAGVPRGGMQIQPAGGGNGEYFTTIAATPAGATNADRRVGGLDVYAGGLYAYAYGWLHDYFLKRSDCVAGWYPSHYGGAQTFKIRNLNLMITTMYVPGLGADTTLNLPEAYTGVVQAFATDAGSGKNNMGAAAVNGTQVRVYAGPATNTNILLIGYKNNI